MSFRAGFIGLIGLPNSGKSTIMNKLVGEKVSIVTAKPQTTRRRMIGIVNKDDMQAIFVDAPGVVKAHAGLNLFLRDEAMDVMTQSDVIVAVLNIDEAKVENLDEIIALAKESGKPWIAVIHKTDLAAHIHRPQILRARLEQMGVPVVQGSSLTDAESEGLCELLLEGIKPLLPAADGPLYDSELYTTSNMRELVAEIIRERCFENLHQEIPFGLAVKIIRWVEDDGPLVQIAAEIIVAKENHQPIVIGKDANVIKRIGTEARKEIVQLIGRKIFLDLNVATKKNWQKNPLFMKDLGYVVHPT